MTDTWADRIVAALRISRLPLDDDELARRLGAIQRQTINQTCRRLEGSGVLRRHHGPDGKIVNSLTTDEIEVPDKAAALSVPARPSSGPLTEDEVKAAVKAHLERDGWVVQVAWGRERGVDIQAHLGDDAIYLEAKGEAVNPPQQVNYFLGALGELVQRLTKPAAVYGLALPDNAQYRGLVDRLPVLARERLNLAVYFVNCNDRTTVRVAR